MPKEGRMSSNLLLPHSYWRGVGGDATQGSEFAHTSSSQCRFLFVQLKQCYVEIQFVTRIAQILRRTLLADWFVGYAQHFSFCSTLSYDAVSVPDYSASNCRMVEEGLIGKDV
jgi:hypothetical protein